MMIREKRVATSTRHIYARQYQEKAQLPMPADTGLLQTQTTLQIVTGTDTDTDTDILDTRTHAR